MLRKNKVLILSGLILMLPFLPKAQTNSSSSTSSPYSRFGIGTLSGYSYGRSDAMGGIGIGLRYPFQVNAGNPASYTALDSLSFLVDFVASSKHTQYETQQTKNGSNDANFDYLAFSFPLKKWWGTAFGVMPFTQKGYNINLNATTENQNTISNFNGSGALSRVFWGNGFKLGKNLSVGFNAWYMFGTLTDQVYIYFPNDANAYDYLSSKSLNVHNFGVSSGLQYSFKNKKKNTWTLGAVFEPKQNLGMSYTIHEERSLFRGTSSAITSVLKDTTSLDQKISLPLSFGFGVSYSLKDRLILGADYYYQKWSQSGQESYFIDQLDENNSNPSGSVLTNMSRYSAGVEWTPNENSLTSYWKRAHYRGGLFYNKSYLFLDNQQINGYGVTFGFGLPFPRSRSSLNLSAEIGHLGSKESNLIKEDYVKFTLNIFLYDRWFVKRKID
jgi:hypothetical protein